jgi:putative nucleotidyltransferase with HDIG domain
MIDLREISMLTLVLNEIYGKFSPETRKELIEQSINVAELSVRINSKLKEPCDDEILYVGAFLHDIGKKYLDESLLIERNELSEEEKSILRTHAEKGYNFLKEKRRDYELEYKVFFSEGIFQVIHYHHERLDGKGYPLGLKENEIPKIARIVTAADCCDAYNKRIKLNGTNGCVNSHEEHIKEIPKTCEEYLTIRKDSHLDPEIVDVLIKILREPENTYKRIYDAATTEFSNTKYDFLMD